MRAAPSSSTPLGFTQLLLRLLSIGNVLVGATIFGLLVASVFAPDFVARALSRGRWAGLVGPEGSTFLLGLRTIMVIGIVGTAVRQLVLNRLVDIVETVEDGDPFVSDNAARLRTMAWAVLGLEALRFIVVFTSSHMSTAAVPVKIGDLFSSTRWLVVLLLFVLARVFEQGTSMRDELAGTV